MSGTPLTSGSPWDLHAVSVVLPDLHAMWRFLLAVKKDAAYTWGPWLLLSALHIASQSAHLTVAVVPVSPHQVDTVAVLVPESPLVGQGAVGDGRVRVLVEGGEGSAVVVGHGVTWGRGDRG